MRCWFAPEDLKIGDKFRVRIDEAIRLHDKLLIILSEESVQSTWVENEVESAFEKEDNAKKRGEDRIVLFPIRLDSAVEDTDAASPVVPASRANPAADPTCVSCALVLGNDGDAWRPCQIFPGKSVSAKGWCSVWAPKP